MTIRCVYQESYRNDPALVGYARWFTELGGHLRTAPALPMLMIVYDRELALLPVDPADNRRGAIEVRSPGLVAATYALFEQIWTVATPFGVAATVDAKGLEPSEQELIRILAAGHTDEVASRRLGVSLRTVRRIAAEVMERLGARSRSRRVCWPRSAAGSAEHRAPAERRFPAQRHAPDVSGRRGRRP